MLMTSLVWLSVGIESSRPASAMPHTNLPLLGDGLRSNVSAPSAYILCTSAPLHLPNDERILEVKCRVMWRGATHTVFFTRIGTIFAVASSNCACDVKDRTTVRDGVEGGGDCVRA
ncbi:hypothetical protein BOTBODRAFT_549089 [Botryobasidium botryosum FD-172 SS1]|uniref:Secreted protein n=1 Tax=Botryobasidium botryosum (strain FD-172 SS1) TaxID=930990 RepID=A0A067MR58_BOTB1|nr:hypothetical protein BOTBODRAFT_549089 [Botryobasidium botryosum FD-172 SS1]